MWIHLKTGLRKHTKQFTTVDLLNTINSRWHMKIFNLPANCPDLGFSDRKVCKSSKISSQTNTAVGNGIMIHGVSVQVACDRYTAYIVEHRRYMTREISTTLYRSIWTRHATSARLSTTRSSAAPTGFRDGLRASTCRKVWRSSDWCWCRTVNQLKPSVIRRLYFKSSVPCRPNLQFSIFNFWHSSTLALSPERQSARMSEIENVG